MRTVLLKHARRRKFTELVADHVFGHENGLKILSVMNEKRVPNKIRRHHRAPRPGLDRFFGARVVHLVDLIQKMRLDEGSFLQRSSHKFQVNSEKLVRGETPQLPITFQFSLLTHRPFFFDVRLSKMKRSLGLCFERVLNPLASCPHGLTG